MQKYLIKEIDDVLNHFSLSSEGMAQTIYKKYYQLKEKIKANDIKSNLIKGSVRAYLDAFNDYKNPILNKMYNLEKEIDLLINTQNLTKPKKRLIDNINNTLTKINLLINEENIEKQTNHDQLNFIKNKLS